MIVITKIEIVETENDIARFVHLSEDNDILCVGDICPQIITEEVVRGHRFRHPIKGDFIIGFKNEAAEILGLQFEAFENLSNDNYILNQKIVLLKKDIDASKKTIDTIKDTIKNAGFFKRLKWLFNGIDVIKEFK